MRRHGREVTPLAQAEERIGGLLDVARVINSSLELNEVLERILSQAARLLDAESGSIMLMEESPRRLRVLAARGPRADRILGHHHGLDEGVSGWVARHGKPLRLHGVANDRRFRRICERLDVRDALCAPLKAEDEVIGVISLNNHLGEPFTDADLDLLIALCNQAALAIRNARSFHEMRRQRQTVERLLTELNRAQEEERLRVALQIHDGPAQTLHAALRNLEAARVVAGQDLDTLGDVMSELERTIRQAIKETRAVMLDLRPPSLDDMGLHSALEQYAEVFTQRTGIRTSFILHGLRRRLPGSVESSLYRIAQEALTNVWKHAEAREVRVTLCVEDHFSSLEVCDDGKGLTPEVASNSEAEHLGLVTLRERAELVGGELTIDGSLNAGTTIRVRVPLVA
jgi:signal transduction histidine kinase